MNCQNPHIVFFHAKCRIWSFCRNFVESYIFFTALMGITFRRIDCLELTWSSVSSRWEHVKRKMHPWEQQNTKTNINIIKDDNWSRSNIPKKIKLLAHSVVFLQPPYSINGLRVVSKKAFFYFASLDSCLMSLPNLFLGKNDLQYPKESGVPHKTEYSIKIQIYIYTRSKSQKHAQNNQFYWTRWLIFYKNDLPKTFLHQNVTVFTVFFGLLVIMGNDENCLNASICLDALSFCLNFFERTKHFFCSKKHLFAQTSRFFPKKNLFWASWPFEIIFKAFDEIHLYIFWYSLLNYIRYQAK